MNMKRLPALLRGSLGLAIAGGMLATLSAPALACSSEPLLGSICVVTYARGCPYGFLPADGRSLPINQNAALYALIGTTFGGNGTTTFNLPNLNGRVPVGVGPATQISGQAPTSTVPLGQYRGAEGNVLTTAQLPPHNHPATFTPLTGPASVTIPAHAGSGAITATATTDVVPGSAGVDPAPNVSNYYLTGVTSAAAGPVTTTQPGANKSSLVGTHVSVDTSTYTPAIPQQTASVNTVTGGAVAVGVSPGGGGVVPSLPPQLGLWHCIATQGLFPSFD